MLRILILDGIPLSIEYLEVLSTGLSSNENLRTLSLARCRIADAGCSLVLESLGNNINLGKLNLTSCNLTGNSGYSLSAFLKKRQLLLESEWAESPGSNENSKLEKVRGLHTLILNQNPEFSDFGLRLLIDTLKRDFWLKVLKLRSCGLRGKGEVFELLRTNCTIKKLDFRQNHISSKISETVKNLLKKRKKRGDRISMKKRLLTKKHNFSREIQLRKRLIKSSRRNKRNHHKNRIPNRKREKTYGICKTSRSDFNQRTKSVSRINTKIAPEIRSEDRKAKFVELKLRLSNIIEYNQQLSRQLKDNRELIAKENKSRIKIEKCCDKIGPEIAKISRGILVHVEKEAKKTREIYYNVDNFLMKTSLRCKK
ncbi:centrosomal protein of 78 kDa-like [Belonocnema kinseyi]|uniref:centrosomal protein of 78 kDa-like n=1 Tax=Belonocnema kinseyi TaxID=2817044 RepID=UPI00143CCCEE|nr:centrosomal protein of 78 kDa-like [Belonocnema kinseyi]XP_033212526.1 centrosomal protein of 78 kDa-like [Belonocnema kinseyi]